MHLMIFDPHERGHYLTYVRYLLQSATCATRVTLVLREGVIASEPYQQQLANCVHNVDIEPAIGVNSFRRGGELLDDFSNACQRHRPDHVWVPSADVLARSANLAYVLQQWRFPAGMEGECGLIELRFHRPARRWRGYVRQAAERSLLGAGPWVKIHTIDPTAFAWVQARGGTLANRLSLVPDAMDHFTPVTKETARRALDIPLEGRYVVSVGSHAVPRKGSQLLLEAFVRARLGSSDRLLLAGMLGDELKQRLQTEFADLYRRGRLVVVDKYLDDADLMNALAASDVVCTPYFDHVISSGIVLRAAQAGRPVLAPRQGWLGDIVPRFQLGETGDILDVAALAAALEKSLERADGFRVSRACERLVEYSSARNFAALWAARLRERMGLPREDGVRTWEWVLRERGESRPVARELNRPSGRRFARIYPRSTREGHIEGASLDDEP